MERLEGLTIGQVNVFARPGAWCRPGEWVFARQPCDKGCLVLDVTWLVITWHRGEHRLR